MNFTHGLSLAHQMLKSVTTLRNKRFFSCTPVFRSFGLITEVQHGNADNITVVELQGATLLYSISFIASRFILRIRRLKLRVGLTTCHMRVRLHQTYPPLHYDRDALTIWC